jgi:hypothetical protein
VAHPYRGHAPTPDDKPAPEPHNDQDIDTAGTEADTDTDQPGDEDADDLVGPTGEEMPKASHDERKKTPKRKPH